MIPPALFRSSWVFALVTCRCKEGRRAGGRGMCREQSKSRSVLMPCDAGKGGGGAVFMVCVSLCYDVCLWPLFVCFGASIWLPLREVLTPCTSGGVSCVGARVRPGFQGQILHAHARGPDFAEVACICGPPRVEQRQPVPQGRPLSLQRVRCRCSQKRAFEEAESQLRGAAPDCTGRDGRLYLPRGNPQHASPPGHHIRA
jgi:hypothetical protein